MHVYSVTPPLVHPDGRVRDDCGRLLAATAAECERVGWSGILVPHNLHEVDPWLVASHLGSVSNDLIPLLAVQPACVPPHTAAACAGAFAALYGRPLYFNLVAGARDDEMQRIGDRLSHDERYERIRQYGRVLRTLLDGKAVDEEGFYYAYRHYRLEPRPEVLSQCRLFVAGSSPASLAAGSEIADVLVTHPAPYARWRADFIDPLLATGFTGQLGIRIGIIARPDTTAAWQVAHRRYPQSWLGRQETLLKTRSQNTWSRQLAEQVVADGAPVEATGDASGPPGDDSGDRDPYWLGAFSSGLASAPFLVGSHSEVAGLLAQYAGAGVGHLLLNGGEDEDNDHVREVLRLLPDAGSPVAR